MRILVLSNNDGGLYKFRKELLEKLCEDNTVICSVPESDGYIDKIEKIGCKCIRTCIDRRGKNPLKDLKLYKTYLSIIKREKPDIVLTYTIKPNIYGGIACQKSKIPYITNVTGLGTAIENGGIVSKVLVYLYKIGLKKANCIFFQNAENKLFFEKKGVVSKKTRLIPGSGVNTSAHTLEEYPEDGEEFRFLFVGRVMKDKGIEELLKAIEIVHNKWKKASLDIVGDSDEDYSEQIEKVEQEGYVKYHGKQSVVHDFYKRAHCVVLPSYHEGMANVLLEAESTGRPVIASRIPGCQETFDEGITGLGCAAKDVDSLVKSMEKMLTMTWDSRKEMGLLGREKVIRDFERIIVVNAYVEEIEKAKKQFKEHINMDLYEKLLKKEEKLSLVGLGYVGMPIAVAFARKIKVIGFDLNSQKIDTYKKGIDPTHEVGDEVISKTTVEFTADETKLREAKFHIVAVPTPVNDDHTPDLRPVEGASEILGRNLTKGSIVVFESTVYPGVTEDVCVPILERESGLKCGVDFKVGYSPERINPGDKVHRLETITKIVSGMDEETLDTVAKVYELVVEAGVHRAESIKVAEAAKVIENSQRDINIAFMNELSIIFNKMGIDTQSVLKAAGTKWNFLNFYPGLVGGHCIGVDPYYLTYKAEELGYHSQIILSGRRINDDMGKYVAENCVKNLIAADKAVKNAKVAILGFTFKENCPDTRNTKIIDIVKELKEYGIEAVIADPEADADEAKRLYGVNFVDASTIKNMDAVILAVAHKAFSGFKMAEMDKFFGNGKKVLLDLKGLLNRKEYEGAGYSYWRL